MDMVPQRIAIVRALPGLGDMLCAVPAWRALRAAWPNAHITLIGLPSARWVASRFGQYIDRVAVMPGFPGLVDQPLAVEDVPAFLTAMQHERFDLALQMHGSGTTSNVLTMLLGAHTAAGFVVSGHYRPHPQMFIPYPTHEHEVVRQLRLIESLGVPLQGDWLEFPITPIDRQALGAIDGTYVLQPSEYVCVHPGASTPTRCWPPQQFARVADALAEQGLQVVLTGSDAERELAATVARAMRAPALNLAGRTELGALGALLHRARFLVCNDTGVSHLAAAVGTASVVIFLEDARRQWAPLNHDRHRSLYDWDGVTVDAVLHQAQDVLWRTPARALVH